MGVRLAFWYEASDSNPPLHRRCWIIVDAGSPKELSVQATSNPQETLCRLSKVLKQNRYTHSSFLSDSTCTVSDWAMVTHALTNWLTPAENWKLILRESEMIDVLCFWHAVTAVSRIWFLMLDKPNRNQPLRGPEIRTEGRVCLVQNGGSVDNGKSRLGMFPCNQRPCSMVDIDFLLGVK